MTVARRPLGRARTAPASLKDVAREAGVSLAAASYAINGKKGIAADTRSRILAAVERLSYRPSKTAQAMRTGRSDTIGLILPDLGNPFFPQFARAVQQSADAVGRRVFLIDTGGDERAEYEGVANLIRHGVDGIIWWPVSAEHCRLPEEHAVPVIFVDALVEGFDTVTSDHRCGGVMLGEMINRSAARRIGLIRGPFHFRSASLRRDGLVDALAPSVEIVWECANSFSPPLGTEAISALSRRDVDLIVCPNDLIAIEVLRGLKAQGISVPDEVSVTGFGDIQFSDMVAPPLTTIRQPLAELGRKAIALLDRRIKAPGAAPRNVMLPVHLVERESMRGVRPAARPTRCAGKSEAPGEAANGSATRRATDVMTGLPG